MQKQMKYANNCNVPYVVLIGEKELIDNTFIVKDMLKGEQKMYAINQIEEFCNAL